ncbi:MAG: iron-containing alcohol dehydrogenase [Desulfocapsa sp.]|nr:iron-containing alcohol dehydrogenase [Desulfocapsa sp.]
MPLTYSFHSPVKTYVGEDFDTILLSLTRNAKNISIVSGATSIIKTGFKKRAESLLHDKNLLFFSEIEENPSIDTVVKGGAVVRNHKTDLVVAFGGGSAIDAAKAVALLANNQGEFYEILKAKDLKSALPVVAIPSTCGTGSEMNSYSIITDLETMDKVNISKESMFPVAAILEPSFLKTLDDGLIRATVFDAFSHAFEGYLSKRSNPFSDTIALSAIDLILETVVKSNGFKKLDDEVLADFLYASSLAGIVILHTGTTLLHALGYYFTNQKKIHHGKANAILLDAYVSLCRSAGVDKLVEVDKVFEKYGLELDTFAKPYFGQKKVSDIVPASEADVFVKYAIGKPNAVLSPFDIDFEEIKQALY